MTDTTPEPDPATGEPLEPFTDDEIIEKARGVITGLYMLADVRDPDWETSMILLLGGMADKWPPNTSTLFLVPMVPHANGRWLNGRVPALTTKAEFVPIESCLALMDKIQEFWRALNPEIPPVPQSGP
jgi:hypothetical protein